MADLAVKPGGRVGGGNQMRTPRRSPMSGPSALVQRPLGEHDMTRFWLAVPAVCAMTIGGALAQTSTTTSTQTTVPAPATGSYSATETQKTTDGMGTVTNKTQTYNSGTRGTNTSATVNTVT